jgi:hypothetical protein
LRASAPVPCGRWREIHWRWLACLSSNNKLSTGANVDNHDNTGLVSVADVIIFGDDRHKAGKISAWILVMQLICDQKNVNIPCTTVRASKIS